MSKNVKTKSAGFGLIQIIFSVLIASALTGLATPTLQKINDQSLRVLVDVDREQVAVALEHYYRDHGSYPVGDNADLVNALKGKYLDFNEETLEQNIFSKDEFVDPWGRPYIYHYQKGDETYHFRFQGMPHRPLFSLSFETQAQTRQPKLDSGPTRTTPNPPIANPQPTSTNPSNPPVSSPPVVSAPQDPQPTDPVPNPNPQESPQGEDLLPLHAVANDGMVFVTIEQISLDLDRVLMERQAGESAFENLPLQDFDASGNTIWFEGSHVMNVLDFNVVNEQSYTYRGQFWTDPDANNITPTDESSARPTSTANQALLAAQALLRDAGQAAVGQYGISTIDIFESLETHQIPIIWGYEPRVEVAGGFEESTLGYTLSFSDRVSGEFREYIVVNSLELQNQPESLIASLLAHEGTHHFWNHDTPALPNGVDPVDQADLSTPRGSEGRSDNSIDEEYEAFLISLRFWEQERSTSTNQTFDQLVTMLNGPNGESELRSYVRTVYRELDEY